MWGRHSVIKFICVLLLVAQGGLLFGQIERKELIANRVDEAPKIDGQLDDEVWQNANIATDFYQYLPFNDRGASFPTKVYLVYDDDAIYIGARLLDPNPDSILTELGVRDANNELNADQFSIDISPFNDGVNGFTFKVSASGVQTDINRANKDRRGNGDLNWDAVWKSKVSINSDGWTVEIEIPYAALRFPKRDIQEWGINFWRDIRRLDEYSSWNFADREVRDQMNYLGVLKGLEGIKPPLRLSLFPYVSGYVQKIASVPGVQNTVNGGMDLKWGINESFTMDITLIPDFGQVKSDEKILNLSPYEVRYDEN
ncbi:MAG: carbohydrate binding family 9 domain-containing protein, partial [Cyclobacteriaceae bacterium]|nr:carbohydrate binding family 9 domain-containing protein [Cyclobacteriaceae bacterium]